MDTGTKLSYERTFLAYERTQMAWVRTSLALISFGFGIAKFFQYLSEIQDSHGPYMGPRTVGMIMIAIALVGLALASVQHRRALQALRSECPGLPRSTTGGVAWAIMALGVVSFMVALF